MKYALGSLLFAGALALSFGAARADVLVLTSSALKDNDQLAIKNACADKQRSPNCIGENISPPLAWSGAPEGTKSFAIVMLDRTAVRGDKIKPRESPPAVDPHCTASDGTGACACHETICAAGRDS